MLNDKSIEINLPSKLGYEQVAMECSAFFAKIVGFLPERIEDVKTAVSEACLNAIEHGNLESPDKRVIVSMNYKKDVLTISIIDEEIGIGEHHGILVMATTNRKIKRMETSTGFGMSLIKQLVDQVEFN